MPGMGGMEPIAAPGRRTAMRILVLSAHEDTAHPPGALRAGALGYLAKRSAPER